MYRGNVSSVTRDSSQELRIGSDYAHGPWLLLVQSTNSCDYAGYLALLKQAA